MSEKRNVNSCLAPIVLALYFSELVFPKLNTLATYTVVCLACLLVWLVLCCMMDIGFLLRTSIFPILFIYASFVVVPYLFGYSVIGHRYANMGLVLCGTVIYQFYYTHNRLDKLKTPIRIALFLALITMLITYKALLEDPYISRSIKSSGEYSDSLADKGIGGYTFVYFVALMSIVCLYCFLQMRGKAAKIISGFLYIFCLLFIIKSNYMTAFLTVIFGTCILILFNFRKRKHGVFASIVVCAVLIVAGLNLDSIVSLIADFLPVRISNVIANNSSESVVQSISNEFLFDRWPVMLLSIEAFFEHPFVGLLGSGTLNYSDGQLFGFGQHSYILDTFALYGIIGGILNIYLLIKPFVFHWKHGKSHDLDIAMAVSVIILYLFNNASESIALVATIIYPFISDNLRNKEQKENIYAR